MLRMPLMVGGLALGYALEPRGWRLPHSRRAVLCSQYLRKGVGCGTCPVQGMVESYCNHSWPTT